MQNKKYKVLLSNKIGKAEIAALIIYVIGICVITSFHEPWFDELQAWQIAKYADIKDILFTIPHDEGHPQLWHLILVPFAKCGAPVNLTLKVINTIFCTAAVALLLFKSPFPKVVKCTLPFTYFLFYQYGVISRPYSVFFLAFMLMAVTYKNRDDKPLSFILSMALACFSHSYGIIICGMISVLWLINIIMSHMKGQSSFWSGVLKDKRCWCLLPLAIFAVILIMCISPGEYTYNYTLKLTIIQRIKCFYMFFMFPADSTFTAAYGYENFSVAGMVVDCIFGVLIFSLMIYYAHKRKMLLELLVPYLPYALFMTFVYSSPHHIGTCTIYYIYFFWISEEKGDGENAFILIGRKVSQNLKSALIEKLIIFVLSLVCIIPVIQSAVSSYNEIRYPYGYGEQLADFIKKHNLQERNIMSAWSFYYDLKGLSDKEIEAFEKLDDRFVDNLYREDYTRIMGNGVSLSAYLDENIIMNFNADAPEIMYMRYQVSENQDADFKLWHDKGLPDLLIDQCRLSRVYSDEELEEDEYVRVFVIKSGYVWKYGYEKADVSIFIRKSLLDEYPELKEIPY